MDNISHFRSLNELMSLLAAHHHTYHVCEDLDYQIFIETDFLVLTEKNVNYEKL